MYKETPQDFSLHLLITYIPISWEVVCNFINIDCAGCPV